MKTLFTIHAGEFLVGEYIEKNIRKVNVWIPSRDTGIDLLVTDSHNHKSVSPQVKFSRDFLPTDMKEMYQEPLRACGWWKLKRKQIAESRADYWIFVLIDFALRSTDFVVIKPSELLAKLDNIHEGAETFQRYLWVTKKQRCWETRNLKESERREIAEGQYSHDARDFTQYLSHWDDIKAIAST